MADYQTDAIDETTLVLIVETTTEPGVSAEVVALLKNRAAVMAFLTTDERPRYRRFAHSQLFNHFLGEVAIDAIGRREMPKFVRRNVFGADFLSNFGDLLAEVAGSDSSALKLFVQNGCELAAGYLNTDRGARNIGAFLIAALPAADIIEDFRIKDLEIDEAVIRGTAAKAVLSGVTVSQLDLRGASVRTLIFRQTVLVSLIADHTTEVSPSFPDPSLIQDETPENTTLITNPGEISEWLNRHGRRDGVSEDRSLVPMDLRNHGLYRLLGRACRFKQYWIRSSADDLSRKIVDDPLWPELSNLLEKYDFLRKETHRQASGRPSTFFHIKRGHILLSEDPGNPTITPFYRELAVKAQELSD
jgi:hypothetical protein